MKPQLTILFVLLFSNLSHGQSYSVGFKSIQLKDSTRTYKPHSSPTDSLHYRPVDLDIWYPSDDRKVEPLTFGNLFELFEQRAIKYQDTEDYAGMTEDLASFYVAELGVEANAADLLTIKTNSFPDLESLDETQPVIIYMAGLNGMGFENYKILEKLAQNGYVVVSVWSVGRFPGDMTNEMEDMLEQVYDAEFSMRYLKENSSFKADFTKVGILGCSWGGMGSAVLIERNPGIKSFVSLDGTETHYFGQVDEDDQHIAKIHDSNLLKPEEQTTSYLYFESGDKLADFIPEKEYNYFEKKTSEKSYLRFENSTHADFLCIPSILNASQKSVEIYSNIEQATVLFFDKTLKGLDEFQSFWEKLLSLDNTSKTGYDFSTNEETLFRMSGQVVDGKTRKPVAYANVGVLGRETGTVTDLDGNYTLLLKNEFANDTLRISSIGYKTLEISIKEHAQKIEPVSISLEEQTENLNEVVVTAAGLKEKTLGNKTESRFISTGFSYDQLGAELGIRINIAKSPTFVDAFNFTVSHNRLSQRSIFRLNFYTIKNGKPDENILSDNILISIDPDQTGQINVDLKTYDIVLDSDVIVALEWIDSAGKNNKGEAIFFSLGLMTNGTLYKKSSHSVFKKHSNLGVGFSLDVQY